MESMNCNPQNLSQTSSQRLALPYLAQPVAGHQPPSDNICGFKMLSRSYTRNEYLCIP